VHDRLDEESGWKEVFLQADPRAWINWKRKRGTTRSVGRPDGSEVHWCSRCWSDVSDFLEEFPIVGHDQPSRETLAQLARDILAKASDMDGPMPEDVSAFIRDYGDPAV
jgi:hypothetical protein